ncbi:hypothetical protein [Vibrio agarivorans]|uniref:Uncharacterized protein n=1 Tax=Vibrio agarivorans TaxID=153622 RepID=A0ABT7Y779_9VIBR|nr:hypothetical protein [Vibrio agarivorans]MDN2483857.1 hypothetical protein [Vibrio agarivorans]
MDIVTYEQRLNKIKTVSDIDEQIRLAKQYFKRLQAKAKACEGTLSEKLAIQEQAKSAERVFRQLRINSWDIEDSLAELKAAS